MGCNCISNSCPKRLAAKWCFHPFLVLSGISKVLSLNAGPCPSLVKRSCAPIHNSYTCPFTCTSVTMILVSKIEKKSSNNFPLLTVIFCSSSIQLTNLLSFLIYLSDTLQVTLFHRFGTQKIGLKRPNCQLVSGRPAVFLSAHHVDVFFEIFSIFGNTPFWSKMALKKGRCSHITRGRSHTPSSLKNSPAHFLNLK